MDEDDVNVPKIDLTQIDDADLESKLHPYSERGENSQFKKVGISILKQNPITKPKLGPGYMASARNVKQQRLHDIINNDAPLSERTPRKSIARVIEDLRVQSHEKFIGMLNYKQIEKMQEEIDEKERELYLQELRNAQELHDMEEHNSNLENEIFQAIHSSAEITKQSYELQKKRNETFANIERLNRENAYNCALIDIYKTYENILMETARQEGYNDWKQCFKTPEDFLNYTEKFENENLFLSHQVEEKMQKSQPSSPRKELAEPVVRKEKAKNTEDEINFNVTNPNQAELDHLSELVNKLYLLMYKTQTTLPPYEQLIQVEKKMEEIYRSLERVKPSFLKKRLDEIDARNALERRLQFREDLEKRREEKKRITLERALREVKVPAGRKLMPKSSPRKFKIKDPTKQKEEEERRRKEQELLFGDIFSD